MCVGVGQGRAIIYESVKKLLNGDLSCILPRLTIVDYEMTIDN